ncbi:MAG: hypothetical protein ACC652_04410 [Acidimicrobiales bacterium]
MERVATGAKVLLRAKTGDGEWHTAYAAMGQQKHLALTISEVAPWMELEQSVQALVLADDLNVVFDTKFIRVDRATRQLVLDEPNSYTEVNRRRSKRIVTEQEVEWSPLKGVEDHIQHSVGLTIDISVGGLRFAGQNAPNENEEIVLALLLPIGAATGFAKCLETRADRTKAGLYVSRLELMWSHPASHDRLRNWLDASFESASEAIRSVQGKPHLDLDTLL